MASLIHLDTHAVIWLAAGELLRFSPFVPPLLQQASPVISPIVLLELDYLHEVGKLKVPGRDIVNDLAGKIGLALDAGSFTAIVQAAADLTWTRDPFDRLIAATARAAGAPLLTKDATILAHERSAFGGQPPL